MPPKPNAPRARIQRTARPRRLAVELLETRQLLSLPPGLPEERIERAEQTVLAADESLGMPRGRPFVNDAPAARAARLAPLGEVGAKPFAESLPIQTVVIVSVLSRRPNAPAWGVESWNGPSLRLSPVSGPEGEAQGHPPQASGSSLDFVMPVFSSKPLVIEVSRPMIGLMPILPLRSKVAALSVSPLPVGVGSDAVDAPVAEAAGMPTLQKHVSVRSALSPNMDLKSLPPFSDGGRDVDSLVADSLNTVRWSSLSHVAAPFDTPFDAQGVTGTMGVGWQVPNIERPLLPNADAVWTELSVDRIRPRTEDGFIDLQTNKSRETASVLVTDDVPARSTVSKRQADEQDAHTALASDLSWRLLMLHRQDSDADQDADQDEDRFDGESSSVGLASSDLAHSVDVMRALRLELPDDTEDGGMVVIEAPGVAWFRTVNPGDGALAVGNRLEESTNTAGNGVEMDAVCGRIRAFEVSGANAVGAPPAAARRAADDPADSPRVDKFDLSTPSAASAAPVVDDLQATGPNRAAILPLLLTLVSPFLARCRRRNAASTSERGVALARSRPNFSAFLRWLLALNCRFPQPGRDISH